MTITAEQVARAIEAARADDGGISDALGGWQWDKRAPDYVRVAWGKSSLPDFIAALTRWHAELVAVATPRAAEAERADKPDHLAYADSPVWDDGPLPTPTPERPAPRFKVGEWVRVARVADGGDTKCIGVEFRILSVFVSDGRDIYVSPKHGTWEAGHLEPASPPAPEVVDVPQPRIVVKRCDEVEAEWTSADATILIVTHDALDDAIFVPIALLRAMLEAIDSQQGGAS